MLKVYSEKGMAHAGGEASPRGLGSRKRNVTLKGREEGTLGKRTTGLGGRKRRHSPSKGKRTFVPTVEQERTYEKSFFVPRDGPAESEQEKRKGG